MVFFALTRQGLDEFARHFGRLPSPLWVNKGVLSREELDDLRARGGDVTDFAHMIGAEDAAALQQALADIAQHHPGERIWVERMPDS